MTRFRAYDSDSDEEENSSHDELDVEVEEASESEISQHSEHEEDDPPDDEEEAEDEEDGDADGEDEEENDENSPPPEPRSDPSITPWAREIGVESQKMHVMQASFFRASEDAAAFHAAAQSSPTRYRPGSRKTLHIPGSVSTAAKHAREPEMDPHHGQPEPRVSFAHNAQAKPFRPTRKFVRVANARSVAAGLEGTKVDHGLALGRSFRVGWGPGGKLAYLGSLCAPSGKSQSAVDSSVVNVGQVDLAPLFDSMTMHDEKERVTKLLVKNLLHTDISLDDWGIPLATPSRDLTFKTCLGEFSSTNNSFEAMLFRLGHALFDPIDLRLGESVGPEVRRRVEALRRKTALSRWLESTASSVVDVDIQAAGVGDWASNVFALLTGHQVSKACDVALDAGNPRLATLISQAGGDAEYKSDLRAQLATWRDERIDVHIPETVRKIYGLLAGIADVVEGSNGTGIEKCSDVHVSKDLDWKRALGLQLWYSQPLDATIGDVYEAYNALVQDKTAAASRSIARPSPWYIEYPPFAQRPEWKIPAAADIPDALFSLIRLFADPSCTLSDVLDPLSFSPAPADARLPWHIYILLSRCLRAHDLADRGPPPSPPAGGNKAGENGVEGNSPTADLLASSFALQLERMGKVHEAVFVLLHIEGPTGRKRAIKDLLARNASSLDASLTAALTTHLRLPVSWLDEAKANYALNDGEIFRAYELYLSAGLYNQAHQLAAHDLAPEAVIKGDLELLKELFRKFKGHPVENWQIRGKAYLDYAHAMVRLPQLYDDKATPSDAAGAELDELARSVPKLIGVLAEASRESSDIRYKAALAVMMSGLASQMDRVRPLALGTQLRTASVPESTKLHHVRATMYENFMRTIEVA